MDRFEMSNEFDVLYNNIMSNLAPGIDEYEKSLFLTKALDEILKGYFNRRGNKYIQGFDDSEKRLIDFSSIITTTQLQYIPNFDNSRKLDYRSKVYRMPKDCFIIVNELIVEVDHGLDDHNIKFQYTVEPISYQSYSQLMTKPYKFPPKHIVWRVITNHDNDDIDESHDTFCEIIGKYSHTYSNSDAPIYKMRYIKHPSPIILIDLNNEYEGLTIDGYHGPLGCELPEEIHHEIVLRAVELAIATYNPQMLQVATSIGNISSTNLGVIPQNNKD